MSDVTTENGSETAQEEFLPGFATREAAVAALTEAKDAKAKLEKVQEEKHRLLERVLTAPATPTGATTARPVPEIDFNKLPNPAEDPAGYAKALLAAQEARQAALMAQQEASARTSQAAATYISEFHEAHPDLAGEEMEVFVERAFRQVSDKMQRRGSDIGRALQVDAETIFEQVATEARKQVAKVRAKLVGAKGDTRGTAGGSAPITSPEPPPAPKSESFIEQLRKEQRRVGILRDMA